MAKRSAAAAPESPVPSMQGLFESPLHSPSAATLVRSTNGQATPKRRRTSRSSSIGSSSPSALNPSPRGLYFTFQSPRSRQLPPIGEDVQVVEGAGLFSFAGADAPPSPEEEEPSDEDHELYTLLPEVSKTIVQNPSSTIEGQLLESFDNDPDFEANSDLVVQAMEQKPTSSAFIVGGKKALTVNMENLKIDQVKCGYLATQHEEKALAVIQKEEQLLQLKKQADEKCLAANMERDAIAKALDRVQASRVRHQREAQENSLKSKKCRTLYALGEMLQSKASSLFGGDHAISTIGAALGLPSPGHCGQLSVRQSLAILHTMDVCGLFENRDFMSNWILGPSQAFPGTRDDWIARYGRNPHIKTGHATKEELNQRVSHYLGYGDPPRPATIGPVISAEQRALLLSLLHQQQHGGSVASASNVDGDSNAAVGGEANAAVGGASNASVEPNNDIDESPSRSESNNGGGH